MRASPEHSLMCCRCDCGVAGHEPIAAEASWSPYAEKFARKGLSDRYPRKNQTFRQMPHSLPRIPTLEIDSGVRRLAWPLLTPTAPLQSYGGVALATRPPRGRLGPQPAGPKPAVSRRQHSDSLEPVLPPTSFQTSQSNSLTRFPGPFRMERLKRPQR